MCPPGWRKWSWENLVDQVRLNCDINADTGCWIWRGGVDKDGYPKLYIGGRHWRGNRAVLRAVTGVLGDEGMHSCDTPQCMAPPHLTWGTSQENTVDAFRKGRRTGNFRPMYGSANGRSKLTDSQREEILRRAAAGERPRELAVTFGVGVSTVQQFLKKSGVARRPGRPTSRTSVA